jgi:hypothetical protein
MPKVQLDEEGSISMRIRGVDGRRSSRYGGSESRSRSSCSARLSMHLSELRSNWIVVHGVHIQRYDRGDRYGMVTSITCSPSQNLEGGSR